MTLYKLNTDVIELPEKALDTNSLFNVVGLIDAGILVPVEEKKCCDKCYSYTGGQVVYCINLDCTCHKPVMTPKTNEQTVEEWEKEFDERCGNPYLNFMDLSISDKEKNIIKMRLENHTLEEVAKEYGVTRERIRQIEAKATEKIRQQKYVKHFISSLLTRATAEAVEGERARIVGLIDEMERDCLCSPLQTEICDIERTFRRTQLRIINLVKEREA